MPQKRIADRRIYGVNPAGREVLIALPGHPLPDWYVDPGAPVLPPAGEAPEPPDEGVAPSIERIPKRAARAPARPRRTPRKGSKPGK